MVLTPAQFSEPLELVSPELEGTEGSGHTVTPTPTPPPPKKKRKKGKPKEAGTQTEVSFSPAKGGIQANPPRAAAPSHTCLYMAEVFGGTFDCRIVMYS